MCFFDNVEQKVFYFRVVSARKTTVRLLNVPRQTESDAICRFKELGNDGRRPGRGRKRTVNTAGSPASQCWERFLFTDEKLFTVQQVHNSQNDRIWRVDTPSPLAIGEYRQYPKSVRVWRGSCSSGKAPLVFVEEGVKVDQKMYQRDIIEAVVLSWYQKYFGNANWTLQQDCAPVYKAKKTQESRRIFQACYHLKNDHLYSPAFNPMDYSVHFALNPAQNFGHSKAITSAGMGYTKGKRLEVNC
ncbi:uncharacterized protein TNCV_3434551 [Trichonephila clavipes]|nr:uncharacterized protein TNCV_3434551 [Trichonephila clavipes]